MLDLAVTGVGALTAAGDAFETYFAARAGLSRLVEIAPDRRGLSRTGGVLPVPPFGHSHARSADAAALAVAEARAAAELSAAARLSVYICLPDPARPDAKLLDDIDWNGSIAGVLQCRVVSTRRIPSGAAAVGQAVLGAASDLESGAADAAAVVACDSLLRLSTLRWLDDRLRLKTEIRADGIIPGEAGACMILERRADAVARRARPLALIAAAANAEESGHSESHAPCLAVGATDALRRAVDAAGGVSPRARLSDMSGESARAKEIAFAEVRALTRAPEPHLHPADCYGDPGAAAGVLLVSLGSIGISRGELASPVVVETGSDGPARAAIILTPIPQTPIARPPTGAHDVRSTPALAATSRALAREHAEEAAFLWTLRDRAAQDSRCNLAQRADLDTRLAFHVEGAGLKRVVGAADLLSDEPGPGEFFAATCLGLAQPSHAEPIVDRIGDRAAGRAAASALAWLGSSAVSRVAPAWLAHASPEVRRAAVAAIANTRHELAGETLHRAMNDPEPPVRSRALRAAGQLAASQLAHAVERALDDPDAGCRCWAAWSGAVLNNARAVGLLRKEAEAASPCSMLAADTSSRRMTLADAAQWRASLASRPFTRRVGIVVAAAAGDPAALPWLLDLLNDRVLARAAADAFVTITGLDLTRPGFGGGPPADHADDDETPPDPDDHLPWPVPSAFRTWWRSNEPRFTAGVRHLCGVPMTEESLRAALADGTQAVRRAAALELAMRRLTPVLVEVRSRADRAET